MQILFSLFISFSLITTSMLYESPPMYYTDQQTFLNAACQIETEHSPEVLLEGLKKIEVELGRHTTFQNGPRVIDLDILLYNDLILSKEKLSIPHPRIHERAFVLKPLCDMNEGIIHPVYKKTLKVSERSDYRFLIAV